jgi:monoamine oxidase
MDCDVAIIGAGVAGLAAAGVLTQSGLPVRCLEATSSVGGRIRTVHDPLCSFPIELGAEFVHGLPAETWAIVQRAGLHVYEHSSKCHTLAKGQILAESESDKVFSAAAKSRRRGDESFDQFLRRSRYPAQAKTRAARQVEGFDAARTELISLDSLKLEWKASEEIEGDRSFRIIDGYDSLVHDLLRSIPDWPAVVQLNSVVERVKWRKNRVLVTYRNALDDTRQELTCRTLIVTVSLGVLQGNPSSRGHIEFDPPPVEALKAANTLILGHAFRVTFHFSDAFWEEDKRLRQTGFLFSEEKLFPTWWTTQPLATPILTGWMAGGAAHSYLKERSSSFEKEALASLRRILGKPVPRPLSAHFHDWSGDPFFLGAYSYVPTHAIRARGTLAQPVEETLFFAGEATETSGNAATVHGAIASGLATANRVRNIHRKKPSNSVEKEEV